MGDQQLPGVDWKKVYSKEKTAAQIHEERIDRIRRDIMTVRADIIDADRHFDTGDATLIAIATISMAELLRRTGL